MDAVVTLLLLVAPYVLLVAIDRVLPGGDQHATLFPPPADLPWPRGVQEQDMPRWVFYVHQEPPTNRPLGAVGAVSYGDGRSAKAHGRWDRGSDAVEADSLLGAR